MILKEYTGVKFKSEVLKRFRSVTSMTVPSQNTLPHTSSTSSSSPSPPLLSLSTLASRQQISPPLSSDTVSIVLNGVPSFEDIFPEVSFQFSVSTTISSSSTPNKSFARTSATLKKLNRSWTHEYHTSLATQEKPPSSHSWLPLSMEDLEEVTVQIKAIQDLR
jgi:hypothetical protein